MKLQQQVDLVWVTLVKLYSINNGLKKTKT